MKIIDFETVKQLCKDIKPSEFYDWIDEALNTRSGS